MYLVLKDCMISLNNNWHTFYLPCGVFETDEKLTKWIMGSAAQFFYRHKRYYPDREKKHRFTFFDENNFMEYVGRGYYNNYRVVEIKPNSFYEYEKIQNRNSHKTATEWIDMNDPILKEIEEFNKEIDDKEREQKRREEKPTKKELEMDLRHHENKVNEIKLTLRKMELEV